MSGTNNTINTSAHNRTKEWKQHYGKFLLQLQCTKQNWEGDFIPLQVLSHILGDLAPCVTMAVILDEQRCLLDIVLPEIMEPLTAHHLLVQAVQAGSKLMCNKGLTCAFSFHNIISHPDLVHVMVNCKVLGQDAQVDDGNLHYQIKKDFGSSFVWLPELAACLPAGPIQPPGSSSTPHLDSEQLHLVDEVAKQVEMLHPTAVDQLIKKIVSKHGLGGVPFTDHTIDLVKPPPGHAEPALSSTEGKSKQADEFNTSVAVIDQLMEKGAIKGNMPKLADFYGEGSKVKFSTWSQIVKQLSKSHPSTAIKDAIMQSLKGEALDLVVLLPPEATWEQILDHLAIRYQAQGSYGALMKLFYDVTMEQGESCSLFAGRLEQQLKAVQLKYGELMPPKTYEFNLKERFFGGLPKSLRTDIRPQYDEGKSFAQLLQAARKVEAEDSPSQAEGGSQSKPGKGEQPGKAKGKATIGSVTSSQSFDLNTLKDTIAKLQKSFDRANSELGSVKQECKQLKEALGKTQQSGPQPSTSTSNANQPQGSSSNGQHRGQWRGGNRGWRGGRGNGGRGRGGNNPQGYRQPYCSFCHGHVDPSQNNHSIKECPFASTVKESFWKDHGTQQATGNPGQEGNL